jgi:pyrroline-5-carboxylate reductase
MKTIGLIGAGNMGSALVKGMLKKSVATAGDIVAYDADERKLTAFCDETGVRAAADNISLVRLSDIIILAVKPGSAPGVLTETAGELTGYKLLISVVLGLSLKRMSELSGNRARCIRVMPNTPALVNEGMTCISLGGGTTGDDKDMAASLFGSVGLVEFMPESDIEKVTSLTGSSPAYIFMLIESMADAAVLTGLPRGAAYKLASQAVLGSAKMALETGLHPGILKDMVCSPAGSTIEAVRTLEDKGFRSAVIEAMQACERRVREISSQ